MFKEVISQTYIKLIITYVTNERFLYVRYIVLQKFRGYFRRLGAITARCEWNESCTDFFRTRWQV